jgi:superfamily II DNA/RNA helicase
LTAVKSFADLGVEASLTDALAETGITAPFPIQELTLPLALSGADLIGQARTGTGKTLAFGLPLLQRVDASARAPQALVVVPTRELCLQVRDDLAEAGASKGVPVVAVYGGKAIEAQVAALRNGAPVVVGTPGRLLDLFRRGDLQLAGVTALVLDEADEMLDLGFLPDVEQIIEACASDRQTLLFSATMPSAVVALARRYMRKPTFLRADVEEVHIAPRTQQHFFSCHRMDKPAVLARILQTPERGRCVVFTRTKRMADMLVEDLRGFGLDAAAIHSDLRQEARERALARFRIGKIDVLVATEVAARGLDISEVTHVVNYDCPDDEKMYLHRIGRTGRAGAAGVAITFAVWNELARLAMIKKALDITVETHEVFSTSPLLEELFDLPERESRRPASTATATQETATAEREHASGPRRPRSRRDRSTPAPAKATPAKATPAEATPAEATPARSTPDVAADDEAATPRRRVRRRVAASSPAAEVEAAPAQAPEADADADAGTPRRRRTRRRTGRTQERAAAARAPGEPEVRTRTRAGSGGQEHDSETARPARERGRSRSRRGATPAREASADRGRGREAGAERTRGREASAERGRAREGRPAREASAERGRGRGRERQVAQPAVDVGAARGAGKPALYRRLVIEHLP